MTMDAVTIETLPTPKSLLSTKIPESTDIPKEKDDEILFLDELDEDDEIRLRLSDDEEVEQDNALEHFDNQEENIQKKDVHEFDVHVAVTSKDASQSHNELINEQDLSEIDTTTTLNQSIENSSDKNFSNEACNLNDEESTMNESEKTQIILQNSRKFWSNNFDKRWKGVNSRGKQNFSHRNANDWYKKHYQDKDKYNHKNNFNHHNNHFKKLRNNPQGSCNKKSGENGSKELEKTEVNESLKLKHKMANSGNVSDKKLLMQENGVFNNAQSKKSDLCNKNDKLVTASIKVKDKETKGIELNANKKSVLNPSEEKLSVEICKENDIGNSNILDKSSDKDTKSKEKKDNSVNDTDTSSVTKNCDLPMMNINGEKENYENKSEKGKKEIENKCNSDVTKMQTSSDIKSVSNGVQIGSKPNSLERSSELSSEKKTVKLPPEDSKTLTKMEIDNDVEDVCNDTDKTRRKDIVPELSDNNNKKSSKNCPAEQQNDNVNQVEDNKILTEDNEVKENSLHLSGETLTTEMEISEAEEIDGIRNETLNVEKNGKVMNVKIETKTSSELIDIIGANICSNDLKPVKDGTKSLENSLTDDKNNASLKKEIKETEQLKDIKRIEEDEKINTTEKKEQGKINSVIEEVDLVDDEPELDTSNILNDTSNDQTDSLKIKVNSTSNTSTNNKDSSQIVPISAPDVNKTEESNEDGRAIVHKRRRRKRLSNIAYLEIASNEIQTDEFFNSVKMLIENGVRQKRRSARNAEEMIRKEILKNDEDDENSSDESGKLVPVNYKKSNHTHSSSPPSLKRTLEDTDSISDSVTLKRIKSSGDNVPVASQSQDNNKDNKAHVQNSKVNITETNQLIRQISQEDIRGKLKKLKQEELEALLLQKIVECITIRGEMGKLREQARVSKRNQEATRNKCQQLQKQVEGFDMVLKRISYDKNSNNDKYVPPIKINRSVGLQVNFLSDHGIHNLKQIQAMKSSAGNANAGVAAKSSLTTTILSAATSITVQDNRTQAQSPRKMMKVRSPRRPEATTTAAVQSDATSPATAATNSSSSSSSSSATSTALVMSKPSTEQSSKRTITLQNSNNVVQLLPVGPQQQQQQQQSPQAVIVNSSVSGASTRPTVTIHRANNNVAGNKTSDLIDLTDEEDKSKTSIISPITSGITTRFPRVLQAVPASVALTSQTNIRLVQSGSQGSQTAIVNNINTPRLAYVMQSGVPTRQLVLTNSSTIRPVTSVSTRNISTISYKQGVPALTNGTVRVLTTQTPATNLQHPAPLPESPVPESNASWKSPPPAPSLKISKVATGIVLSWNMSLSDKFAEIVSYQLYAYQEVAGTSPSASLWKKVGDVRALPLPMACTLTQFTEGNNYYFAVRAVDIHSRFGQYSKPGNISL